MSGDCREQPVIFYSEEMTVSKMILLAKKGVTFKKYEYLLDILEEENAELQKEVLILRSKLEYYKTIVEQEEE